MAELQAEGGGLVPDVAVPLLVVEGVAEVADGRPPAESGLERTRLTRSLRKRWGSSGWCSTSNSASTVLPR
jgi:hypothetical protein